MFKRLFDWTTSPGTASQRVVIKWGFTWHEGRLIETSADGTLAKVAFGPWSDGRWVDLRDTPMKSIETSP